MGVLLGVKKGIFLERTQINLRVRQYPVQSSFLLPEAVSPFLPEKAGQGKGLCSAALMTLGP